MRQIPNRKTPKIFFTLVFTLSSFALHPLILTLRAIEIPLEGFGKASAIAYVDMHKIFESYPDTEKARVELSKVIEEKKAGISVKKEEIAKLKGEIEYIKGQLAAVEPSTQSIRLDRYKPIRSPGNEPPNPSSDLGSKPPPPGLTALTLPENSPLNFLFTPPESSTVSPITESSTAAAHYMQYPSSGPQLLPGIPSLKPQLAEKEKVLAQKEQDLALFLGVAEEEVNQLEEGKTMTLMARIYKSLEEIAAKEGYAIILDRTNILYGETGVDITQNVIWRLSSPKFRKDN